MLRRAALIAALALAACAPRGTLTLVPQAAGVGDLTEVFVATSRAVDPATGAYGPGRQRGALGFARYEVSVPPGREIGQITWPPPGGPADPARDFVTADAEIYGAAAAFRADLGRALAREKRGEREAMIFVHGFNTTYAEGIYRIAQLSHDLEIPGVPVHYAWPSIARPLGYAHDLDSAMFGRDGLGRLLEQVSAAGAERIILVAHSMGTLVTMETLRQLSIAGRRGVLDKVAGVVLIAPDLDVDVFHSQATRIGHLPQPFIIFTSRRDRALALSARLTGQRQRLGNLRDLTQVADLKVTVVDVAAFNVGAGHFNVGESPALIRLLSRFAEVNAAYGSDSAVRTGLLPGAVLTVQNATALILSPVTALAGAR